MDYRYKIVKFDEYCHKCENWLVHETDHPCDECLAVPVREGTRIPEKFKEKEKKNGR